MDGYGSYGALLLKIEYPYSYVLCKNLSRYLKKQSFAPTMHIWSKAKKEALMHASNESKWIVLSNFWTLLIHKGRLVSTSHESSTDNNQEDKEDNN